MVCSGGGVRGVGPIADALRTDIADRAWVSFGPEPDCRARLVPWNDQLLHWLVVAHAHGERLQVKTHYRPRIGRLPPMLRRILCGVIAATAANQREHIVF